MSIRSIVHGSFTITREWKAPPARVFAAFADEAQKRKWFGGLKGWEQLDKSFDFRVGGREMLEGRHESGMVSRFECVYHDIVAPDAAEPGRIIYSYVMHVNGKKISVSQAAIQFAAAGSGTRFNITEHGDYLDGYEDGSAREHGTNALMDMLGESLSG